MDGGDVRVVQRGQELRLALEALLSLFTFKEIFRQYLDRDVPIEAQILRPVDLAHSTRPEERDDLIGAQPRGRGEGHRRPFTSGQFTTRSSSVFAVCPAPTARSR